MTKMPVLFVGHGSPLNAIEDNEYTKNWQAIAARIPRPEVIIAVSAHWYSKGTHIMNDAAPPTIYDMYGFPDELYEVVYDAPGSPEFAETSKELISRESVFDDSWGIDHGSWSVLVHIYPDRDIPVFQISVDGTAAPEEHYKIGQELKALREQGALILGSGNVTHNLRLINWNIGSVGFDWATDFDDFICQSILNHKHQDILNYKELGEIAKLAVPTPDHFYPLLYPLGASDPEDKITVFNQKGEMGSMTMTGYLWE
ncbi:MAG: 4,5-DOPA dioxygenase extradiol [Eubacteriales bacterium]|nr:4,5-DOPA dioxygenase extradiol [Eubacteriales bacterium]